MSERIRSNATGKIITVTGRLISETPEPPTQDLPPMKPRAFPAHSYEPGDTWYDDPITLRRTFDPAKMRAAEDRLRDRLKSSPMVNADYSQVELRVASDYLKDPANEPLNPSDEETTEPPLSFSDVVYMTGVPRQPLPTDTGEAIVHVFVTETPLPLPPRRAPAWLRQAFRDSVDMVNRSVVYEKPVDQDLQRSTEKGE